MTVGSALVSWSLSLSSVSPHIPDHFISLAAYFWWYFHPGSPVEHSLKLLYVVQESDETVSAKSWALGSGESDVWLVPYSYYNFNILKGLWYVGVVW